MTHFDFNGCQFAADDNGRVLWVSDPRRIADLLSSGVLNAVELKTKVAEKVYFNLYIAPVSIKKIKLAVGL